MKKFVMTAVLAGVLAVAGSANAATFTYTGGLIKVGSRGTQVMDLQRCLADMGVNPGSNIDGVFGPITKSAVMSFQASKSVAVDGIIGPITGPLYTAACAMDSSNDSSKDDSKDDSDLSGGVGDISLTSLSAYSGEDVGEGSEDVPVMSVDVEAGDDSDVRLDSVKVEFYQSNSADSRRLYKYADEITVWFDGEQVGSADADEFSESSNYYSKSIELDGVIIRAGEEKELTFAVTALENLDSGDIDSDAWQVDILNVRFTDGDGVVTTSAADAAKTSGGTYYKAFDFDSFATANDAELKLALGDDDINDSHVLDADDSNDTDHDVLSFTLEAAGDSDIWVDEIPVVITTTGDTTESNIVVNASLWVDGERISGKEDVPDGGAVLFDDLDYTIEAGDEVEFILNVEMQDIDGALDDGDTVQATVTVASIDAEDEVGESVTATGSAVGDAHTLYDNGIQVKFVGATSTVKSSDTTGINETVTFKLQYDVTAFGDDMYVSDPCTADDATDFTTATTVYLEGDADHSSTTCTDLDSTGTFNTTGNDSWEVKEGKTERFTVTVIGNGGEAAGAGNAVTFKARLAGIAYTSGTAGNGDTTYNFNLDNFKSQAETIYDR